MFNAVLLCTLQFGQLFIGPPSPPKKIHTHIGQLKNCTAWAMSTFKYKMQLEIVSNKSVTKVIPYVLTFFIMISKYHMVGNLFFPFCILPWNINELSAFDGLSYFSSISCQYEAFELLLVAYFGSATSETINIPASLLRKWWWVNTCSCFAVINYWKNILNSLRGKFVYFYCLVITGLSLHSTTSYLHRSLFSFFFLTS